MIVDDTQLSLAIGKKGQNVRLAAKLLGWKIDIKSEEEKRQEVEQQMSALVGNQATPLSVVPDLGEGLVEKLTAAGITTVEQLADMTPEQLEAIPGIGPKTVEKISIAVNNYFSSLEAGEAPSAAPVSRRARRSPCRGRGRSRCRRKTSAPKPAVSRATPRGCRRILPASPESVSELVEEGQDLEAASVSGVENAPPADEAESSRTHDEHPDEENIPKEEK